MSRAKFLWAIVFFSVVTLTSGCETLKGAAEGAKKDWQAAKKIDDWMRENLW